MANAFCEILITTDPIHRNDGVFSPVSGAVVEFFGVVRGLEEQNSHAKEIAGIDYEAHVPMAEHQLRLIAEEAAARFQAHGITLHHRIGWVPTAEPSLWVRVATKHRADAFAACQWIIDQLKLRVPIWKRPKSATKAAEKPE